jgi:hypothetical protein
MADETPRQDEQATAEVSGQGGGRDHASKGDWWLDRPTSIALIIKVLIAACVLTVLADFFYHKHGDYSFQEWIAFDAVFGFLAYVGLITVAKLFRKIVMRDEDYYD